MERDIIVQLQAWKNKPKHKPLILNGARQVGKTWILKEFGRSNYHSVAYVNFESAPALHSLLQKSFNIKEMIEAIQIDTNVEIVAGQTLIIFDEIQLSSYALTSLKYFQENAPEYHIIAAGSLFGISMAKESSFPVGKVEFLNMYPMNFIEFLDALNENELKKTLINCNFNLINTFHERLKTLLRLYYYIGGMPEAISSYITDKNLDKVREIQKSILESYELDFSKHAPNAIVPKIRLVWNNIPMQLAKENKKFIYKKIKPGARSKEFESALLWLQDAGLIYKVNNIQAPKLPIKAYEDPDSFKIFILDVGLLGAMVKISSQLVLERNLLLSEFKGILTEQYVLQQLIQQNSLYYWSEEKLKSEVDFILEQNNNIIPLEVKAEENLKAKSLRVYQQKFNPQKSVRTSMSDYRDDGWLVNIPLVSIGSIKRIID